MAEIKTVKSVLENYLVMRELRASSAEQMRTVVSVFLSWAGADDLPASELSGKRISEFFAAKQAAGRSCHYRKGLRNAMKALHRFSRDYVNCDPIRPVRLDQLSPAAWTPEHVAKLVKACDELRWKERDYWRHFILVGYYTGLNAIDIFRLKKSDIDPAGYIVCNRSKTGKRVFVALPPAVAAEVLSRAPETGPIWPKVISEEGFRLRFKRLVRWAKIPSGSFKQLRKTSGTLVELNSPGQGHRHLGHSQQIFERHYEDIRLTQANPTMPPELKLD